MSNIGERAYEEAKRLYFDSCRQTFSEFWQYDLGLGSVSGKPYWWKKGSSPRAEAVQKLIDAGADGEYIMTGNRKVLCEGCKYRNNGNENMYCDRLKIYVKPDFFCAYAAEK